MWHLGMYKYWEILLPADVIFLIVEIILLVYTFLNIVKNRKFRSITRQKTSGRQKTFFKFVYFLSKPIRKKELKKIDLKAWSSNLKILNIRARIPWNLYILEIWVTVFLTFTLTIFTLQLIGGNGDQEYFSMNYLSTWL